MKAELDGKHFKERSFGICHTEVRILSHNAHHSPEKSGICIRVIKLQGNTICSHAQRERRKIKETHA